MLLVAIKNFFILCTQLSSEKYEKEVALQQVALLQDEIRECNKNVQELQAAKEQLEQDSFFLHNSYQKLEDAHQQVLRCVRMMTT